MLVHWHGGLRYLRKWSIREQRKIISQIVVPLTLFLLPLPFSACISLVTWVFQGFPVLWACPLDGLTFFLFSLEPWKWLQRHSQMLSIFLPLCPRSPVFQTLIRISPTDCFLCSCWKAEPSWRNHTIMLISSIISLWASSSAGPLSQLSNPFTYVSHQLPVPFPMVAVIILL